MGFESVGVLSRNFHSGSRRRALRGLILIMVRLSATVLACSSSVLGRLLGGGRSVVIRLCLQGAHISFGRSRLIKVIRVNFLLAVGLHQEDGKNTNCERKSEHSKGPHKFPFLPLVREGAKPADTRSSEISGALCLRCFTTVQRFC